MGGFLTYGERKSLERVPSDYTATLTASGLSNLFDLQVQIAKCTTSAG